MVEELAFLNRNRCRPSRADAVDAREACVLLGLRNVGAGNRARREANEALAVKLAQATPQDCLDAAFTLAAGRPSEVVAGSHGVASSPPFEDRAYYAAIARWLGCRFDDGEELRRLARQGRPSIVFEPGAAILRFPASGGERLAIAPCPEWLPGLAALLTRRPELGARLLIVSPRALVRVAGHDGPLSWRGRLDPLHAVPPSDLADKVVTRGQIVTFLAVAMIVAVGSILAPVSIVGGATIAVTAVLLAYAASRGIPLVHDRWAGLPRRPLKSAELPVYTVLIPLYREDEGLAHLIRALRRLDYPADKLDIQFLVEADDDITQRAIEREARHFPCRMTIVPAGVPRTKPRALNVGLRQAEGDLVTIFDAEDRPDPEQLRIAAETFAAAPPELAALQARLTIENLSDGWLPKMFAIEYACLFEHVMPMVSSMGRLLLLGGTSNHFRIEALLKVGGWDPFNVTEDADLAVRLRRFGYRLAMIDSETHEEAPLSADAWVKQRSRWFKGYIQTWLVHNREPVRLVREVGWADAGVFHLFIIGSLTAGLAHILFMVQAPLAVMGLPLLGGGSPVLMAAQSVAVLAGYGASLALGVVTVRRRSRLSPWIVFWLPGYWVLMGCAVIIAIHDIVRKPHHWRKTTHGLARRPSRITRK
ncbi:glycosyltransferase family 2 protein [Acuticoccus mangrovi]|uniref:Glycosyltransferase n=1 Tax=Acuticoccus mangrovi TaxID=2796142 RepID=A0A934IMY9_9HYPH|nr:glycosyltransferase [Acuticoccus mangrovi]